MSHINNVRISPIRACLCSGPNGFIWLGEVCRRFRRRARVPGCAEVPGCPGAQVPRCPDAQVPCSPIAL
eukprot:6864711-Pyramimonas_sp.AAC.1